MYLNHNKKFFSNDVQKAKMLASLNKSNLDGYDAMLKDVWLGIIERTQLCIRSMIELIKQMPYIQKIIQKGNSKDLKSIINHHHFYYIMVY